MLLHVIWTWSHQFMPCAVRTGFTRNFNWIETTLGGLKGNGLMGGNVFHCAFEFWGPAEAGLPENVGHKHLTKEQSHNKTANMANFKGSNVGMFFIEMWVKDWTLCPRFNGAEHTDVLIRYETKAVKYKSPAINYCFMRTISFSFYWTAYTYRCFLFFSPTLSNVHD